MKIRIFTILTLTWLIAQPVKAFEMGEDLATTSAVQEIAWDQYAGKGNSIYISGGTSQILRFDRRIVRAAVSDINICDITTVGTSDVLVFAKKPGNANLIVWDSDNNIATFGLQALPDMYKLEKILKGIDPKAEIKILPFNETVSVYGTTETSGTLKQMQDAIKIYNEKALIHVKIREPKQVLLEVRFAEVNRTLAKEYKLDLEAVTRFNIFQTFVGKNGITPGAGIKSTEDNAYSARRSRFSTDLPTKATESTATISIPFIGNQIALIPYLKWLEENSILKVIARPNLVTKDGEEAEFSVGGEFPVPVASGTGGQISIQYKEFGTKMLFKPEMLGDEVIRLNITAEVSELDFSTTVTSGGVEVPAVNKRLEKTVSEMKDNQTLVIGGLISQKVTKTHRKVPGLGDVPVLKVLFNADTYDYTEVELLIVVTPHIVKPFETGENKQYFDVDKVKQGMRALEYASPEPQGNAIANIFIQGEPLMQRKIEEERIPRPKKEKSTNAKSTKSHSSKNETANKSSDWNASLPSDEQWSSLGLKKESATASSDESTDQSSTGSAPLPAPEITTTNTGTQNGGIFTGTGR